MHSAPNNTAMPFGLSKISFLRSVAFIPLLLIAACSVESGPFDSKASSAEAAASSSEAAYTQNEDASIYKVATQDEYKDALKKVEPGDTIVLANGTWTDFEILFKAKGEEGNPVTLTAETRGKVILSGQSNLRLAGEHLVVSGLVFKDGFTPTSEVIAFRQNAANLANHSRITEVVIDNYNNPERQEVDSWVMMFGKHNRFDHNHLVGKRNRGVTMAVRMATEADRENYHRIDHNYFGPRQILGSNGGETLRIGTSHYSRSDSFTTVEYNYFDRCDGELEIISNKSGRNEFKNNTFYESRGTLTMRHGNNNLVENNVFFGNGAEHTGGIRVINAGQTIRNNYMEGLKGTRFGGALVVMNGVPNGPINRYDPVINATIEDNTLINSDNVQLGAGSDEERSGTPQDSTFSDNIIYHEDGVDVFTVYDDMSGIDFTDNILASQEPPDFATGFTHVHVDFARAENGLMYPVGGDVEAGVSKDIKVTTKEMTGPSWYPKTEPIIPFASGKTITVGSGENAISEAVSAAEAGDILMFPTGSYVASKFIKLDKPLTFKSSGEANFTFERTAMFEVLDGGSLQLIGLNISGKDSPDNGGNSVIRTSPYAMLQNYRLEIIDSHFTDIDINHSFNIITTAKGTFADNILIKDSSFEDVTGTIARLDREDDDNGIYNAEYLTIENSTFKNIGGDIVDFYRGGRDESTFGPHFKMTDSNVTNAGLDKRNKSKSSLYLHGVQVTDVADNSFDESKGFLINHTVGEPKTVIVKNRFKKTPRPENFELNSGLEPTAIIENNRFDK